MKDGLTPVSAARSVDTGVSLAFTGTGHGPPLVKARQATQGHQSKAFGAVGATTPGINLLVGRACPDPSITASEACP